MFHHKNKSSDITLFEIRLKSPHKNLLLLRGNEHECEQIPFHGSVKLSIPHDMHVKRINLKLVGEYKLDFFQRDSQGMATDQISEQLCCLDVEWPNLLTDDQGRINFGDYGDTLTKLGKSKKTNSGNNSTASLSKSAGNHLLLMSPADTPPPLASRPSFFRASSQPHVHRTSSSVSLVNGNLPANGSPVSQVMKIPKSGIDGTPFKDMGATSSTSFLLPKGNYNLPFRIFLPTNISESVEGLNCGHLLYRLDCNIERGRFEKTFHKLKHIRILRTLHPQNLNLIETVDINNTWPKKVQYAVRLQKKAVAVGANVPINILIVPITKGLKLKAINGCLVQHFHVMMHKGVEQSPEFEEIYGKQEMSFPDPELLPLDQWSIKSHFKIPTSLRRVTQTCDLKNGLIQVKHRLRISIQLLNKEGHVSELRANLPICLYISANTGHVVGQHYEIDSHGYFIGEIGQEDILFKKDEHYHSNNGSASDLLSVAQNGRETSHHRHHSGTTSPSNNTDIGENDDSDSDNDYDRDEQAPPMYQQHIFDKIFDLNLAQSPMEQFRSQANSPEGSHVNLAGYFDQPTSKSNVLGLGSSLPRSFGEAFEDNLYRQKYKDEKNSLIGNPGFLSTRSKSSSLLDVNTLCRVPSYEHAVDEDVDDDDELAPTYSNSGSNSDVGTENSKSSSNVSQASERPGMNRAKTVDALKLRDKRHSKLFFRKDK